MFLSDRGRVELNRDLVVSFPLAEKLRRRAHLSVDLFCIAFICTLLLPLCHLLWCLLVGDLRPLRFLCIFFLLLLTLASDVIPFQLVLCSAFGACCFTVLLLLAFVQLGNGKSH